MKCTCGAQLDFSEPANPLSWFFFSEAEQCALPDEADVADLAGIMKHAVLCPTCGRLWVWWDKTGAPSEYLPQGRSGN